MTNRNETKEIRIGNRIIGGGHPILIQSMCNTKTDDAEATTAQILALERAGCDIIRVAVPDMEAAMAIREIKRAIHIPLVADIHFDYRLAIAAIECGADKIRINPGNIGARERLKAVVDKAEEYGIPIRIGVNSGSLEKNLIEKYGRVTAEGLVESALDKAAMVEQMGYDNLVLSIKSSDVLMCVRAHELLAEKTRYPLHVGITEAGTVISGNIKSAVGLSLILGQGLGDTIRISLTGDPVEEIKSAKLILRTLGLRNGGNHGTGISAGRKGRGYGLRGQRAGRGQGGGFWHCGRQGRGNSLPKGRSSEKGSGRGAAGRTQKGTRSLSCKWRAGFRVRRLPASFIIYGKGRPSHN